jgi:flagellar biosynthesis anti-sigma factor FlgM
MKINDSNVHINFEAYAQKTKDAAGAQEQPSSAAGDNAPVDKVVLSPKAREIQEARKLLDKVSDVDEPKVAHIRLQLDTGVYKIDGSQIAERMMREMSLNDNFRNK